jgi:hypothetical protein
MLTDYLRDPMWAGLFAGCVTILYLHLKAHMNNEKTPLKMSTYMKPSSLIFLLVFFIVQNGVATRESIMTEPF